MKRYTSKILVGMTVIALLAFFWWWGGNAPGLRGANTAEPAVVTETQSPAPTAPENTPEPPQPTDDTTAVTETASNMPAATAEFVPAENGDISRAEAQGMDIDAATGTDQYQTAPVPSGKPIPVEPETVTVSDTQYTCTLSVRCDTILQNIQWLDKEKVELVPPDGVILSARTVTFYEGESVFNVLVREMKRNKIHLEFVNTPIYHSAYIEGIANLYEFDCGELSGWMYRVNGWFPNYGCSRYQLRDGDVVEWVYTCNLGADVGDDYSGGNGR